jgi:CRISPR-associated protein Cas6
MTSTPSEWPFVVWETAMLMDLGFFARGGSVPVDRAYLLYAALSRVAQAFHDPDAKIRFAPLTCMKDEPGRLRLNDRSYLRLRLPNDTSGVATG